jgi:hypothetical protein
MLLNWAMALGACALGGPFWGAITFLSLALLRLSLEAQALRTRNEELEARLAAEDDRFEWDDYLPNASSEPPASDIRPARAFVRARMASR